MEKTNKEMERLNHKYTEFYIRAATHQHIFYKRKKIMFLIFLSLGLLLETAPLIILIFKLLSI